jgi:hypothetical protein
MNGIKFSGITRPQEKGKQREQRSKGQINARYAIGLENRTAS